MVLSSEYHRRQATTLTQLAQTTRNLDTAKALLRMAAETSCRPMRPCGSRNQRTSQVSIAEIPPNRKRYRLRASFACALCEGRAATHIIYKKNPSNPKLGVCLSMKSIDGMIGMTGDRVCREIGVRPALIYHKLEIAV